MSVMECNGMQCDVCMHLHACMYACVYIYVYLNSVITYNIYMQSWQAAAKAASAGLSDQASWISGLKQRP